MWTFERYHRWMEQKKDWVRVPSPAVIPQEHEAAAPVLKPLALPPCHPSLTPGHPAVPPCAGAVPSQTAPPFDGAIEISIDLDDELDLAELIHQVERRSR
jgi:hypothetical protein